MTWKNLTKEARHWKPKGKNVECNLCPRNCEIIENRSGFCKVRGVKDGRLLSFNYGRSVSATLEVIETEAVNHFQPGAKILSLGNVGCMMACDFCQNWETSQIRHLPEQVVKNYTPEEVVQIAIDNGIEILSWTYNDPVVWHEFVMETARLAKSKGLKNLYKSAFYIQEEPVKELIEVIDIFSLSLKSLDDDFYKEHTKARLQPVLDRIKQVHASGRHLEISQLVITDRNDTEVEVIKTIEWVRSHLGTKVPLHFVGFHPAYKYLDVGRTSIDILVKARELALEAGIENCYLGNVYENGYSDTNCSGCGVSQVKRFGLTSECLNLDTHGVCTECGKQSNIKRFEEKFVKREESNFVLSQQEDFLWNKEVNSLHLEISEGLKKNN